MTQLVCPVSRSLIRKLLQCLSFKLCPHTQTNVAREITIAQQTIVL